MTQQLSNWRSFWDVATPQQGATAMIEIYGPAAAEAAHSCASAALNDDRDDDYQFWTAVLECIQEPEQLGDDAGFRN
jgi:hypothetical protein